MDFMNASFDYSKVRTRVFFILIAFHAYFITAGQLLKPQIESKKITGRINTLPKPTFITKNPDLFNNSCFVENIGQYHQIDKKTDIGKIEFAYEGFGSPVLFSASGILHVLRKKVKLSLERFEKSEYMVENEKDNLTEESNKQQFISMRWIG